jgi:hypothetical protein
MHKYGVIEVRIKVKHSNICTAIRISRENCPCPALDILYTVSNLKTDDYHLNLLNKTHYNTPFVYHQIYILQIHYSA